MKTQTATPGSQVVPSPTVHSALGRLFIDAFGWPAERAEPIAAQGSKRRMLRLVGGEAHAVGVLGPDDHENRAFLSFARRLRGAGLPVPEVLAANVAEGAYLLQDLGDVTLFQALEASRARTGISGLPDETRKAYERALHWLVRFQIDGGEAVDYGDAYPVAAFDEAAIRWDLDYFKYHFLKLAGVPFHEARLERDAQRLIGRLLETETDYFIYRDFQSRNIMLHEGDTWFIDFQNGRRGALHYDVASLLFDGKAALGPETRAELLDAYVVALGDRMPSAALRFRDAFGGYALIRILQAMGAYGYLGFYQRKPHFLQSVPHAARNLAWLAENEPVLGELPEIASIIERIAADDRFQPASLDEAAGLTVRIGSFSYKHGYPMDRSGHGGGFVFDCRGVPNPGRSERYKPLCGRDRLVAEYLAALPEAQGFVANALGLVRAQVDSFLRRDFRSLSVAFGCTGGQHRSVWCAERLAADLARAFPDITVELSHRERERWPATADVEGDASGHSA